MITNLKKLLYFPLAHYFRFFAKIQLAIWKPIIIVVTGSSGKTTLLNLIESQLQKKAKYSHFANSSYGIPFDILGLRRYDLTIGEWPYLFLAAPFRAFKKPPLEKLYVVEADCDRPYEGKFLADLLKPEVTLWTNVSRTHTMNFDALIKENKFPSVEETIAYEFGSFLEETKSLVIINSDSELIKRQSTRSKASVKSVTQKDVTAYNVFKDHTEFKINGKNYSINALLPKEASHSIQMTLALLDYLKIKPDSSFTKFTLPPGRCSFFKGIKNTTIIDSSYNETPDGVKSILGMFNQYPSDKKWLVLGDMIELGNEEQEEHEKLATLINSMRLDKIILVGPRVSRYTYPKLTGTVILNEVKDPHRFKNANGILRYAQNDKNVKFTMPKDALEYLLNSLKDGEVILFKGARFLEGVIEHLLLDKNDVKKLCRREKIWQERRKKWGL